MDHSEHIKKLFQRFLDNKCTQGEVRALLQYFDAGENEVLLKSLIEQQSEVFKGTSSPDESLKPWLEDAYRKIQRSIAEDAESHPATVIPTRSDGLRLTGNDGLRLTGNNVESPSATVIPFYRRLWFKISTAAAVILFISGSAFYFLYQKNDRAVVQLEHSVQPVKDIPPGINNATLTLADGTTIVLDSAGNGALATQGGIRVLKMNGQIAYGKTGNVNQQAAPVYNTITTARGNQYQVVLADGSKVWLNAASSIRFPTSFTGNERKVEITGEAYFEVAPLTLPTGQAGPKEGHGKMPFIVSVVSPLGPDSYREKGIEIKVLGTHFNVNAYPEENDVRTTLLEGSVKIQKGSETQMLAPGEQARLTSDAITLKKNVDVSQIVAWKDGFFVFNNSDIKMIMRQVARWYDVEVSFGGKIPEEGYTGKVSRSVPLSKFLKVLELNGISVKADGRKITIAP